MKITKMFFMALASSVLFVSCSKDDDAITEVPLGVYDNGVLIVNEGNASSGSISYVSNDLTIVENDIFSAINPNQGIGGYVQSVFFDGDRAFIISNGSQKITVVNRYTFEFIGTIETGFNIPRYGVVENGKAYVTNLADFSDLTDDFISVINLNTLLVESTIAINAIAERIEKANGKLFVANGSYGEGSTVTVINTASGSIEGTIDVGILCGNYSDNSKLVKINSTTNQKVSEILMEGLVSAQNLNIENNTLYFTVNSDVYRESISATSISYIPLFTSTATTLYGFGVQNGNIFVGDAKDYASDGDVFIYSTTGTLEKQFAAGFNRIKTISILQLFLKL